MSLTSPRVLCGKSVYRIQDDKSKRDICVIVHVSQIYFREYCCYSTCTYPIPLCPEMSEPFLGVPILTKTSIITHFPLVTVVKNITLILIYM